MYVYRYYTAVMLRSELPRDHYERLRVELFSAIARSSVSGPRLVVVQLCRCLVAFAFATIPDVWPNTVVSMIHSLRDATRSLQVSIHLTYMCKLYICLHVTSSRLLLIIMHT